MRWSFLSGRNISQDSHFFQGETFHMMVVYLREKHITDSPFFQGEIFHKMVVSFWENHFIRCSFLSGTNRLQ